MSRIGDTANSGQENQGTAGGATEVAAQVGQNIREFGQQARDAATEKYDQLRGQAQDYYQQGRDRAVEWEQSLEHYVHEKPLQAVLVAAGVGVVLGLLWKRG